MTNMIFEDPTAAHPYFWRAQARAGLSLPLRALIIKTMPPFFNLEKNIEHHRFYPHFCYLACSGH